MEMEQTTPLMAKKLYGLITAILYTVNKSFSKNLHWNDLHTAIKRSTKLAGKAIGNLHIHHQTLTCRPNHIRTTFIAPIEYQFSCSSNTPLFHTKRKSNRRRYSASSGGGLHRRSPLTMSDVRKAFEVLNEAEVEAVVPEKSPLTMLGFGLSPNVRRLRVTDSPFPVNYTEEDSVQVDKAAEEFIRKFYVELMQQKKRAAVEPPSPVVNRRRWRQVR